MSSSSAPVTPIRPGADREPKPRARRRRSARGLPAELATAPAWLSAEAKVLWADVVPALEDALPPDSLSTLDAMALALMVEHFVIARLARETLGSTVLEEDRVHGGQLRKSPASQLMRDHSKAFVELAREYGLTAKSRAALDVDRLGRAVPDQDDDDDLFAD